VSTSSEAAGGAPDAVLTEAARQRLVTIAADVVGRMPPEQVPAALRTIARFTPAKRARLGGTALSAALDADADFRDRVAGVVAEASPQLAGAVREGSSTIASDPVDTAVVAYLLRPERWTDMLADANARWAAERGHGEATAAESARLREEITELRSRLKAETARVRDAAAQASAESAAELTELRRELRGRTGELRAAERAREDAEAALAEMQRRLEAVESAHDAELRRVRSRSTELERAAESARRGVRADRDLDDARLWLLVDTLGEAAAGIRRELSLPPPAVRPADGVASARAAAVSRRADDPATVDRLLALPNVHVVVDGYNVTKTGYPELSLADQRNRLIGSMATLGGRSGAEITVAFDGGAKPPAQPPTPRGVRVLFSAPGEIADDLIRRLVAAEPDGRPVVVVTSDQQIVTDVLRAGAWAVPSAVLLARLG
jgi:predicted RNA-binding protein with PIN domain